MKVIARLPGNVTARLSAVTPMLTSLSIDYFGLGRRGISLLSDLIREPGAEVGPWTVPYQLTERESH